MINDYEAFNIIFLDLFVYKTGACLIQNKHTS